MVKFHVLAAAAVLSLVAATATASAQSPRESHGGGGRAEGGQGRAEGRAASPGFVHRGGGPGGWHGGHDWHGGRGFGGGFGLGLGFGYPYAVAPYAYAPYPDDYAYTYPNAVPPGAVAQDGQWLYCRPANAYYPTVTSCPVPWEQGAG